MTELLNKRFKDIIDEMNDPEINSDEIVFHSLRHASASAKLKLSNGDYHSVKYAGGWANLEMLTRRYGSHSFENDREVNTMSKFTCCTRHKAVDGILLCGQGGQEDDGAYHILPDIFGQLQTVPSGHFNVQKDQSSAMLNCLKASFALFGTYD